MAEPVCPDILVYICQNCVPAGGRLARQWKQADAHVVVREVPCSGKMDGRYLVHALEGGVQGLCVVACPKGKCTLAQGNYRADVRIRTIQRLLTEIGVEPERAELLYCSTDETFEHFEKLVHDAVERFGLLGASPIGRGAAGMGAGKMPAPQAEKLVRTGGGD